MVSHYIVQQMCMVYVSSQQMILVNYCITTKLILHEVIWIWTQCSTQVLKIALTNLMQENFKELRLASHCKIHDLNTSLEGIVEIE
jgi:hypothetical protein